MTQTDDAIAMLKADHHRVRSLFQQYEETHDQQRQRQIAEQVFAELALHAQLEETVFYPAFAAQAGEEGERLVGGARQEHQLFKDWMAELRNIDDEDEFVARFHELRHYVEQHVDEEEQDILPQAAEYLADKMPQITAAMQELKRQRGAS